MTEECPCSPREATLGASPRRRTAASRGFFHPPAGTEADGGGARRGAAARTRTHLFLRGRVPRERAGASRSRRSFGICSSEKTVRRRRSDGARGTEKTKKRKKKRPSRVYDDGAERVSRSLRSGQKRIIGCVMTEECPCSPREATLGASPRRHAAAGRAYVSIIPRRTRRAFRKTFRKTNCRCSFRGSSAFFPCGLRDPGEEHPLNVALSQNAPRLRVFYVRFCR